MVGSSGNGAPHNFTGPFAFTIEYEIQISEQMVGWLRDLGEEGQAELLMEHLAARSGHVNVVNATPAWDSEDDLLELVSGE